MYDTEKTFNDEDALDQLNDEIFNQKVVQFGLRASFYFSPLTILVGEIEIKPDLSVSC